MSYIGSYLWQLRQKIGTAPVIMPGVGIIAKNAAGHIWLGKRAGEGTWSYFGGSFELGDSALDTVCKEFQEEAGIATTPADWQLTALHTNPTETTFTYPNGDKVQIVNMLFECLKTFEELHLDEEHTEIKAFPLTALPTPLKSDSAHGIRLYQKFIATGNIQVN
jgi:8-oxo-dGTP pyrophosphatase MutT (NUDIX family)